MPELSRRKAREAAFSLLFEMDFQKELPPEVILANAKDARDLEEDEYVRKTFFGCVGHLHLLDELIGRFSKGWKTERLSHTSRAILRLATFEMLFCEDIPRSVTLNEAVELVKKFDDPKARAFVNGVLNSIKNEVEAQGASALIAQENVPHNVDEQSVTGENADNAGNESADPNEEANERKERTES